MLTRAWFVFSILWALAILALTSHANEAGRHWAYTFAAAPLLGGLFLKRVGRYIVRGN